LTEIAQIGQDTASASLADKCCNPKAGALQGRNSVHANTEDTKIQAQVNQHPYAMKQGCIEIGLYV